MATTAISTNDPEAKKLWSEKLFRDSIAESYMASLMGDENAAIMVNTDLEGQRGDRVRFGISMRLTGDGVVGNETLEGKEEALDTATCDVELELYRHATRDDGKMTRQRAMFDVSKQQAVEIKDWATEKVDKLATAALVDAPTKIFYGGTATSTATLASGDKLTPDLVSKVASWALTGGNRVYVPFRPVKAMGNKYLILVVPEDVAYDIRTNSIWTQAQREAQVRGDSNPLFTGALGIWSNVIIKSYINMPLLNGWGAGADVYGAKCVLMGQQALCWAWGQRPEVTTKMFDYDNQIGNAVSLIAGVKKPKFDSKDYGSCAIYVARTNVSGT